LSTATLAGAMVCVSVGPPLLANGPKKEASGDVASSVPSDGHPVPSPTTLKPPLVKPARVCSAQSEPKGALFAITIDDVRVARSLLAMPPPPVPAEFPDRVEEVTVRVPLLLIPPPVPLVAEFPDRVEEVTVTTVPLLLIPPPLFVAEFPDRVDKVTATEPRLWMPPPTSPAEFPDRVET
jgi:hypothetical protein